MQPDENKMSLEDAFYDAVPRWTYVVEDSALPFLTDRFDAILTFRRCCDARLCDAQTLQEIPRLLCDLIVRCTMAQNGRFDTISELLDKILTALCKAAKHSSFTSLLSFLITSEAKADKKKMTDTINELRDKITTTLSVIPVERVRDILQSCKLADSTTGRNIIELLWDDTLQQCQLPEHDDFVKMLRDQMPSLNSSPNHGQAAPVPLRRRLQTESAFWDTWGPMERAMEKGIAGIAGYRGGKGKGGKGRGGKGKDGKGRGGKGRGGKGRGGKGRGGKGRGGKGRGGKGRGSESQGGEGRGNKQKSSYGGCAGPCEDQAAVESETDLIAFVEGLGSYALDGTDESEAAPDVYDMNESAMMIEMLNEQELRDLDVFPAAETKTRRKHSVSIHELQGKTDATEQLLCLLQHQIPDRGHQEKLRRALNDNKQSWRFAFRNDTKWDKRPERSSRMHCQVGHHFQWNDDHPDRGKFSSRSRDHTANWLRRFL